MLLLEKQWKLQENTDIYKLVATNKRNRFVSEPNYHIAKSFSENLLGINMRKGKSKNEHSIISRHVNIGN